MKNKWKARLQEIYASPEEWEAYAETYGLLDRLNRSGGKFETCQVAWDANPVITGSINPSDFGLAKD